MIDTLTGMSETWRGYLPAEVRKADGPIYHYTDPAGLLGIVQGRQLWATEASGMNDLAEIHQGWEFIRDWLATQPQSDPVIADMVEVARADREPNWTQSTDDVFFCCASLAEDDANQWRLYAGGGHGYAIELNCEIPLVALIDGHRPQRPATERNPGLWVEPAEYVRITPWLHVLYTAEEKAEALVGLVQNARRARGETPSDAWKKFPQDEWLEQVRDMAALDLARLAQLMKSQGFSGENEVRMIVSGAYEPTTSFRSTPHGILRYIRLAHVHPGSVVSQAAYLGDLPPDALRTAPIRSVRMGPLIQAAHNRHTIQAFLDRLGPGRCTVVGSKVRLRG